MTNLIESFKTSSIDRNIESNLNYQHRLLSNNKEKMVSLLRRELSNCSEFIISVAFITEGGVTLILEELQNLKNKNIKGKIITGDYQNFTQPKALRKLLEFPNIQLKMSFNNKFHAKGYFFKRDNIWNIIIGSSNLTQGALTSNFEWNLKISSLENGQIVKETVEEFNQIFNNLPEFNTLVLDEYEKIYNYSKNFFNSNKISTMSFNKEIRPNSMQENALKNLQELRKSEDKGLLISATGTGKTYLSAFDVKNVKPLKLLFVAHRKTILEKAKETFENLITDKNMGIYGEKVNMDYTFAMIQTLSKDDHLHRFSKDYFDYIIIDEVHHSGAKSYQKVINYFTPKFLLGMTATPERTDSFDIYKLFNHNIAYEIRLHDALKEELLCPFHYFGISDIEIDGVSIDEKTAIKNLVLDERVKHILEKSRFYGYSGDKCHGLIFVSKVEEAKELANKFNEKGVLTKALTGEDSDEVRERTIDDLETGKIEYIITVDLFNEGVDIPCVNQVLLLRPTESSIVYIQQLGRGLRKHKGKEFVTILDFIGNYEKNFLVPVALSQNNSFDKDFMKRFIQNGSNLIPGESSISFEEIVKDRIFNNITSSNFSTKKNIDHDFTLLEKQLGRTPYLFDFFERNMIDPSVILKYKKDYDEILKVLRPKESFGSLNEIEKNHLKFLSVFFTPGKRVHEMLILKDILENNKFSFERVENLLLKNYKLVNQEKNIENAVRHFSKEIFTSLSTAKEFYPILEKKLDEYEISKSLKDSYCKNEYFKKLVDDLIKYNLAYVEKNYKQQTIESIILHKEYTKLEAFWYLNLDYNNGYQVSGYTFFENTKTVIIFITLDDSTSFTSYDNVILDKQRFKWFSQNSKYLNKNGERTKEGKIADGYYTVQTFIKKQAGDNFYYMGEVEKTLEAKEIKIDKGDKIVNLVEYELKLKNEIEDNLFTYLK